MILLRQQLTRQEYFKYKEKAYQILHKVSDYFGIELAKLSYSDVISYFESQYTLLFHFYDFDDLGALYPELPPAIPSNKEIKYKTLVKKQHFSYQSKHLCEKCAGMTYPDLDKHRYVISISQWKATKGRIIFTILHELSHIICHLEQQPNHHIYLSLKTDKMTGNYPPELLVLESEADTVASILYISDERLSTALQLNQSFSEIRKETNISTSALHNRMMDYLVHTIGYSRNYALKFILDYRNGGTQLFNAPKLKEYVR